MCAFSSDRPSALRFFDEGEGDNPAFGGVSREEDTSGVPERLLPSISERKRAARLFVDETASA